MIIESIDRAEDDFKERQVREARVEADAVLAAVEKARQHDAWLGLAEDERQAIDRAINELLVVYHSDDHPLIRAKIEAVDASSRNLAENMVNFAVNQALKGTKI
jgi:molecular chaperone DnaK (HSP70)